MSKKRLFQVFDEMNVNDELNNTALLPCAFTMVEVKSDKRGGLITMGVEAHIVQKIFLGEMQPVLVVMDKKEYYRLEAIPLEDKLQAAEEKAAKAKQREESTTEKITDLMDFVAEARGHISDEEIISQVRKSLPELLEALTPKTGGNEG